MLLRDIVILPTFAFLSSLTIPTGCSFHVWRGFSVILKAGFIKGSCVNRVAGARCQILSSLISEARVSRLSAIRWREQTKAHESSEDFSLAARRGGGNYS